MKRPLAYLTAAWSGEPDGWKPGCGQQDDLARGAVVGIDVDRVTIHACELPDRTGEIGAVHVEKVLIKCL